MLYFIPATISPAEELKSLQERRRVIAVLLNYCIHTATTQSFLKNVFEIIIGNWDFHTSTGAPFISIRLRAHR
jgi:hypothetical protein